MVVVGLARTSTRPPPGFGRSSQLPDPLPRGFNLGRYLLLEKIGAGGMGVVYAAYDPELERRVAIKLLRSGFEADRLVREARAMAKVSHPNVIAVLDVGAEGEDGAFIAMDLVAGTSLDRWLAKSRRSWREIVTAFVEAGRGLAAAHAAGITHGDFKPANVLVGDDGRIRVGDFGLARPAQVHVPPPSSRSGAEPLDATVATMGGIAGTPAYMAPEQLTGRPADARADQYSFCLSIWEALAGERPFDESAGLDSLTEARRSGKIRSAPKAKAPAWVWQVLSRGLAPDPAARHPSMHEVLAALEADPAARRRRTASRLGVGALVLVLPLGTWLALESRDRACSGAAAKLEGVWGNDRRAAVRAAFAALPGASSAGVEAALDEWTQRWTETREDACRATRVRGEQSDRLLDARMACLDRQLHDASALVSVLERATDGVAKKAASAASSLPPPSRCADTATLLAAPPAPAGKEDAIARVESMRAEARALDLVGRYKDALALASAASTSAATIGWAPLDAETSLLTAHVAEFIQSWDAAIPAFERAAWRGLAARDPKLASSARIGLARVAIDAKADLPAAELRLQEARDLLDAVDPPDPGVESDWYGTLATLRQEQNRLVDAIAASARALELEKPAADADPKDTGYAQLLLNHGGLLYGAEDYEGALAHFKESRERLEKALGQDHPDVAYARVNESAILFVRGRFEEALALQRSALVVLERSMGAESPIVATVRNNVGKSLHALGRPEEAEAAYRASIAALEKGLGSSHPDVARGWVNVSDALAAQGKLEEAFEANEKAVRIHQAAGVTSEESVWALGESATKLRKLGRLEEAEKRARKALAQSIELGGPDSEETGRRHGTLGDVLYERRRFAESIREQRRALEIVRRARGGDDNPATADCHAQLAVVLRAAGKTDEAIEQLRLALDGCRSCAAYPFRASYQQRLGEILLDTGRGADAVAPLEEALRAFLAANVPPRTAAEVRFHLAQAVLVSGAPREKALGIAREALASLPESEGGERARILAWIATTERGGG